MTTWIESSYCANGACVQLGWRRSTRCSSGGCVEVAHEDDQVLMRDSKLGEASPVIEFTPSEWTEFAAAAPGWDRVNAVVAGGVRLTNTHMIESHDPVCITDYALRHLHFTWDEWDAFVAGAKDGEFTVATLSRAT